MKTRTILGSSFFTAALAALFVIGNTGCEKDNNMDNAPMRTYTISGNASGSQMVPPVAGSGTGTISGTYDAGKNTLTYTTTWDGLTSGPVTGGFYNGAAGESGIIVGKPWAFAGTLTGTGSTSGTMTLTEAQEAQLTSGRWYYLYGTNANASGEVRGQITAAQQ